MEQRQIWQWPGRCLMPARPSKPCRCRRQAHRLPTWKGLAVDCIKPKFETLAPDGTTLALPPRCPHCGTNLLCVRGPWSAESSTIIDWLLTLEENVRELRCAVEQEVLP